MIPPRILIVEDEGLLAEELSQRIARMGMIVVGSTGSGEEAIALVGAHSPDLVLMDIRLRDRVDGITAASMIRERYGVPVVFITAHSDPVTLERAKHAVPLGYLIKPFGERDLQVAIEMALHKRATDLMTHKLMETQRLEGLGRLADGVARHLADVLDPIIGSVRTASEQAAPGSKLAKQLDSINAAVTRAAELCRQMREYASVGTLTLTRTALDSAVAAIEDLMRVAVAKQATLTLDLGAGGAEVDIDRPGIQQLLMNLLLNAAEAVPDAGAIVVRTSAMTLGAGEVDTLSPGSYAVVEVRDNGIGMDAGTRARIFEPFFTTKAVGRGLGLATAEGIAHAHQGALTVDSAVNQGTTCRLYLPVVGHAEGVPESTSC